MRVALFLLLTLGCAVAPRPLPPLEVPAGENPEAWRDEIEGLLAAQPAAVADPVVFYGSSSIRLWRSLAEDLPGWPVLNRGFGGSRIFDAVYWLEPVLAGLQPRALVIFSGTNDLAGDRPREPAWIAARFDQLVARYRALGHRTPLVYIAISPTPSRERHLELVLETNRLIAARCAADPQLHFIDTASALLDENGRPDPQWFVGDRLHLNARGYASWTATIRPRLAELLD